MLKCELKKFFSKMTNKLILAVLLLVSVIISFLAVDSMNYSDTGEEFASGTGRITVGRSRTSDKNKWKGRLTPKKIADAVGNYHKLEKADSESVWSDRSVKEEPLYLDILYFAANIYQTESDVVHADLDRLAEEDIEHIYDTYADNLQKVAKEYGETPEQEKLLREQYGKIEIPVTYEAYDSWKTMATYAEMYILILVVVIGFLAAEILGEEFRNHTEQVFFTAKYGRSKAVRNKIITGILTTTIVYWVGIGILSLISFGMMGVSGYDTPYQMEDPYNMYIVTQGQYYLLIVVCGYIASLLSASITMLITSKMHTEKIAVFIPIIMYWVPLIMGNRLSTMTKVFYFLTSALVNIDKGINYMTFFQMGNVVIRLIPFVMVLYAAVFLILLPYVYRSYLGYDSAKHSHRESRKRCRMERKLEERSI